MGNLAGMNEYASGAKKRRAISAWTANPNTAESDMKPVVEHVVQGTDEEGNDFAVRVMARDPLWAISMVSTMGEAEFARLTKAEVTA